jgi:Glycosyltransferase
MDEKIKLLELNYHCHTEFNSPGEVIEKHRLSSGFIYFIYDWVNLVLVKHLNFTGSGVYNGIRYLFFKSKNRFWYIPFKTHKSIQHERPDVVLVQGFVFPLQVLFLRMKLGPACIILVQHHGEKPYSGLKFFIQRLADRTINAYLFTSLGNANEWLDKKVIASPDKCYEVLSASSNFKAKDKNSSKLSLKFYAEKNFLWVGRLQQKKDPVSVVKGFKTYLSIHPDAKLYMIFQTEELLAQINELIQSATLKEAVVLVGKIEHEDLPTWYSAADYFISGSHSEGSGYALVEAMTCGCIPVVTDIPSFRQITADGQYGILYEAGNVTDLAKKLCSLHTLNNAEYALAIKKYSEDKFSYRAVARQLYELCNHLLRK